MGSETIDPIGLPGRRWRGVAALLICCGLFMAIFAVAAVCMRGKDGEWIDRFFGGGPFESHSTAEQTILTKEATVEGAELPAPPADGTSIVSLDLSYPDLGADYLHNETPYTPSVEALLSRPLLHLENSDQVQVLILHTHTSEAYLLEEEEYIEGAVGDATYSRMEAQNVLAAGEALCEALKQKGVTAIHCAVTHDEPTLNGSYERAAETVRGYLERYPSITYVIDLHRDAILTGKGEYVRTLVDGAETPTAQVMAVVGSNCNEPEHKSWEENLALALQLKERLNQRLPSLCRPVSLRRASYNQELAPRYLLLEIGSGANTVEEAKTAARLVGEVLGDMLQER